MDSRLFVLAAIFVLIPFSLLAQDRTSNSNAPQQNPKIELPDIDTGTNTVAKTSALLFKPAVTIDKPVQNYRGFRILPNSTEFLVYDGQEARIYDIGSGTLTRTISPSFTIKGHEYPISANADANCYTGAAAALASSLRLMACLGDVLVKFHYESRTKIYEEVVSGSWKRIGQLESTSGDNVFNHPDGGDHKTGVEFIPARFVDQDRLLEEIKLVLKNGSWQPVELQLWSFRDKKLMNSIPFDTTDLPQGDCSNYGNYCWIIRQDGKIKLYDLESGKMIATLEGHTVPPVAIRLSLDGEWLYSASLDGTIRVWDLASQRFLKTITMPVQTGEFKSLAIALSTDKQSFAFAADGKLWLIDYRSGQVVQDIANYSSVDKFTFTDLALSSDGNSILASGPGVIRIFRRAGSVETKIQDQGGFKVVK